MSFKCFVRILVILATFSRADVAHASLLIDLVAYWNLDEESGTRFDSVGSNHLTDNNTVTSAAGILNGAAQFTAANNEYLSIADNPTLSTGDIDFTIAAWVSLDSRGIPHDIASHWDFPSGAPNKSWALEYEVGEDRLRFIVSDDGLTDTSLIEANSFGAPLLSTPHFVIGWHDALNDTINIQVDNGAVDSVSHATGVFDSAFEFRIGARGSSGAPGDQMDGWIDEVGLWKRTLTPEERTTLYEDPGAIFREPPSEPVIPEPSSLLLLGSGLLGLAGWRRRSRT